MNQTYKEIIADKIYLEAYNTAKKSFDKKYNKLFEASKRWFVIYESSFGAPDENDNSEYWELRKILKLPG